MKALLHYFSRDTAQGVETETSFDIADIEKAIREEIANQDPDTARMLEVVKFNSDMWRDQWGLWTEDMSEKQNYYHYGCNEIELPSPMLVVFVEGGGVSDIITDTPVQMLVIDKDTEHTDAELLCQLPDEGGEARITDGMAMLDPTKVHALHVYARNPVPVEEEDFYSGDSSGEHDVE